MLKAWHTNLDFFTIYINMLDIIENRGEKVNLAITFQEFVKSQGWEVSLYDS